MNSFNLNKSEIESIAFADDQIICTSDRTLKIIKTKLQEIFDKVIKWYKTWKLGVYSKKYETILFRNALMYECVQTRKQWKKFQIIDNLNNIPVLHKMCKIFRPPFGRSIKVYSGVSIIRQVRDRMFVEESICRLTEYQSFN